MPEAATMPAVVLGGSGFIGSHLIARLARDGRHRPIVSMDIAPPHERLAGVTYLDVDARRPIAPPPGAEGAVVFDLPALRNYPGHPVAEYYETNILTSQHAIDLAERLGSSTLLFTSTMAVYPADDAPKLETSPTAPFNPYGASKLIAEVLHEGWQARAPGRRLVTVRPAVIFGARDAGNFTRLAGALARRYFVYVGRKDTIKANGYVGDLVDSMLFCLDRSEPVILYNFAYPERHTIQDIVGAFCRVGGYPVPRLVLPAGALGAAAIPFEAASALGLRNPVHRDRLRKLNESTNIVPGWLTANGFTFSTTLESALRQWYSETGDSFA